MWLSSLILFRSFPNDNTNVSDLYPRSTSSGSPVLACPSRMPAGDLPPPRSWPTSRSSSTTSRSPGSRLSWRAASLRRAEPAAQTLQTAEQGSSWRGRTPHAPTPPPSPPLGSKMRWRPRSPQAQRFTRFLAVNFWIFGGKPKVWCVNSPQMLPLTICCWWWMLMLKAYSIQKWIFWTIFHNVKGMRF